LASPLADVDTGARWVLVVDDDGRATVYSLPDGRPFELEGPGSPTRFLEHEFSTDGEWLLSQGMDDVTLWPLRTLLTDPTPPPRKVLGSSAVSPGPFALSPGGRWLAVAPRTDRVVWLWDLDTQTGGLRTPVRLEGHSQPIGWLRVSVDERGDARHVVGVGSDALRVWTIPWRDLFAIAGPTVGRNLSPVERSELSLPSIMTPDEETFPGLPSSEAVARIR
jgi:WD40 repeat protein